VADDPQRDHTAWMELALAQARLAESAGEVPIGAVVVHAGRQIGSGHNHPVGLNDPTAHAEILALRQAATHLQNYRLTEATLYVTLEPCLMCIGAMVHARIGALVYAAPDPKVNAVHLAGELADRNALNHRFAVTQGVMEAEAAGLLRGYFRQRRGRDEQGDTSGS
jgi:tRNA(adenine34) deaminase